MTRWPVAGPGKRGEGGGKRLHTPHTSQEDAEGSVMDCAVFSTQFYLP